MKQQVRECEHRYEFYKDSTEHMNTEGLRGLMVQMMKWIKKFSCSHFYSKQQQLQRQHTDEELIPGVQIDGSEHWPIVHHGDAIFEFPLTAQYGECHFWKWISKFMILRIFIIMRMYYYIKNKKQLVTIIFVVYYLLVNRLCNFYVGYGCCVLTKKMNIWVNNANVCVVAAE